MALLFSLLLSPNKPPSPSTGPCNLSVSSKLNLCFTFSAPNQNLPRHCAVPSIIISRPHQFRYQYQDRHQRQPLTRTGAVVFGLLTTTTQRAVPSYLVSATLLQRSQVPRAPLSLDGLLLIKIRYFTFSTTTCGNRPANHSSPS